MTERAITITLTLTLALAAIVTAQLLRALGSGALLFLAVLGGTVIWLLPAVFALALPAGAFGAVLLTHARQSTGHAADEDSRREMTRLAVIALILSMVTVGWLMPLALREMVGTSPPHQRGVHAARPEVRPATLLLDELIVRAGSVPAGRQELLHRAALIALSFVMPLLAGALVMLKPQWMYSTAVAATLAVFIISMHVF